MGEYISFSQGLLVTIVSMIAVYIVLMLIAFLISCLEAISGDKKKIEVVKSVEPVEPVMLIKDQDFISEELVAIIAAAVAVNLGLNIPDINIRSIKRVPQRTGNWSNIGNIEQVFGRL